MQSTSLTFYVFMLLKRL